MDGELRYTVLVFEDECGTWMKVPEIGFQCCAEGLDIGLDALEEGLEYRLALARRKGEAVPERRVRTVMRVGKGEFGPTRIGVERERRGRAPFDGA